MKKQITILLLALILIPTLILTACSQETWSGWSTVAPTCTEQGYEIRTSSNDKTEKRNFVSALGHDIKWETIIEPDCENDGEETGACIREGCDHTVANETIAKLGHNVSKWTNNGDETWSGICSVCDETVTTDENPNDIFVFVSMTFNGVEIDFTDAETLYTTVKAGVRNAILHMMATADPSDFSLVGDWADYDIDEDWDFLYSAMISAGGIEAVAAWASGYTNNIIEFDGEEITIIGQEVLYKEEVYGSTSIDKQENNITITNIDYYEDFVFIMIFELGSVA